ncbi:glyoxylate/hydroxypyruvate reductase HPR3-like [Macadamia integrifolia]|uniref:glyoxylate/hydroxypyruvate reductase HPR3-like n=1 Tax=Macadamia integrifolia TaxID=60698 RepID=UPI001C4E7AAB|nr:glyoxylate/hydroxypyruvate reductase HPR3-like [Macadamia integrifolia]XP_042512719.1 glyoxylate/hydroxypyruvate reductase HPR3-like [Macadamia integrifolia]
MADEEKEEQRQAEMEKLPVVLQVHPVFAIAPIEDRYLKKFRFLKAWESSMPLDLFLTTHAQSVRALLCSGGTGIPVTADVLRFLPSLRCIVTTSAGLNHIDLAECRRRGIAIANSGDAFSEDVADYAIGLLLDVLRRISAANRYVRQGLWPTQGEYPLGSRLGGKRVGIVGLGHIGSEVAKRLVAFGCSVSYNSRKKKPFVAFPYYSDVLDLAANSDVLIVCCALTKETHHIINRDVLLALGEKGVIVNVGRGAHIDEKELIHCLVQGEIGGAGLDVYENEPHVPKELLALDNVVLSPHRAVFTPESFLSLHDVLIANLEAFFSDKPLLSEVKDE